MPGCGISNQDRNRDPAVQPAAAALNQKLCVLDETRNTQTDTHTMLIRRWVELYQFICHTDWRIVLTPAAHFVRFEFHLMRPS